MLGLSKVTFQWEYKFHTFTTIQGHLKDHLKLTFTKPLIPNDQPSNMVEVLKLDYVCKLVLPATDRKHSTDWAALVVRYAFDPEQPATDCAAQQAESGFQIR